MTNAKLRLHFNFGHHMVAADARDLRRIMADFRPHVCIIEDICAPTKTPVHGDTFSDHVKLVNERFAGIRKGSVLSTMLTDVATDPVTKEINQYKLFELETIRRVPKLLAFYLENHGRDKEILTGVEQQMHEWNIAFAALFELKIQNTIAHYKATFPETANCHRFREQNIAENLRALQTDLFQIFPQLKGAPEVRVFIRYGGDHLSIADIATGSNKITVSFEPEECPLNSEIMRKHVRGEISNIADEVYLRALIEDAFVNAIFHVEKGLYRSNPRLRDPSMGDCVRMAKKFMSPHSEDRLVRCFDPNSRKEEVLWSRIQGLAQS